jgi:two-component system response regulator FlrC
VRELENVMRRAMVLCADHVVTPAHLMFDDWLTASCVAAAPTLTPALTTALGTLPESADMPSSMSNPVLFERVMPDEVPQATDLNSAARMNEHQVIMATLANTPSKTEAAKRLGISPRTLRYKLAQLREHGLGMASAAC